MELDVQITLFEPTKIYEIWILFDQIKRDVVAFS